MHGHRAIVRREEAALDRGPLKALAVVWDALDKPERSALRASCSALRDLADSHADAVVVSPSWHDHATTSVVPYVRGILARGGRPQRLELRVGGRLCLPTLHEFAAVRCLRRLRLTGTPLTAELVAAITAAAPQLQELDLVGCKALLISGGDRAGGGGADVGCVDAGSSGAAGGSSGGSLPLAALLRAAAPTLQHLSLNDYEGDWPPQVSQALQRCTQLQSVVVCLLSAAAAVAALSAVAQLQSVRKLTIERHPFLNAGDGMAAAGASAERIGSDLSRLTKLTELRLDVAYDMLEERMPLSAVACLTGLVKLNLACCDLRRWHVQQLQALTALTYLSCGDVRLHAADSEEGRAGPALGPLQPLPLPPNLVILRLCGATTPRALLSLQLPPSLSTLDAGGITFRDYAADGGWLQHQHAQQVLDACALLAARMDMQGILWRSFRLYACGLLPPPTWAGGYYNTLLAALQPLALRDLLVSGIRTLDLDALVARFPLLEELHIECGLELATVPGIARLQHLHTLRLLGGRYGTWAGWDDDEAVFDALERLARDAPALQQLLLLPLSGNGGWVPATLQAAKAAVARLRVAVEGGSLQRRYRGHLSVRMCTEDAPYDSYDEFSSADEEE